MNFLRNLLGHTVLTSDFFCYKIVPYLEVNIQKSCQGWEIGCKFMFLFGSLFSFKHSPYSIVFEDK